MHNDDHLIKMANDISAFFASDPDHASAVAGMVDHLKKFWDPSMRTAIVARLKAGGEGLSPLAQDAVRQLGL